MKCKKLLEEKYTQIQALKIDTQKKLSEHKELNLTDKEITNFRRWIKSVTNYYWWTPKNQ